MTPNEIQNFCIAGSGAYLNFLALNNKGQQIIPVLQKELVGSHEQPVFKLILAQRLFQPDSVILKLQPPNKPYGPDDFRIIEYDPNTKVLIIQIQNPELNLDNVPPENISVISDLRFLVENVKTWFRKNGSELQLPGQFPTAHGVTLSDEGQDEYGVNLDACQRKAVSTSLEKPLTYVWGPPGTGKTKHVLAQAVFQLLKKQKRVGIFASTNSALEQAMEAILNLSQAAGFSKDKFLRVGQPSKDFANLYPEVCVVKDLEDHLDDLCRQIRIYERVLSHRRGAAVLNSVPALLHEINGLRQLLSERRKIYEERVQLRKNILSVIIPSIKRRLHALDEERSKLEKVINGRLEMIRLIENESQGLNEIIRKIDFTNVEQIESAIVHLEEEARLDKEAGQEIAKEYEGLTDEYIQNLIGVGSQELQTLEAQTIRERIKAAWVIGMTFDCFIGRFCDNRLSFDHIFVDEAGYVPLVKVLTLCRGGVPLTFIGDHKQLGPVCEMDNDGLGMPSNNPAIIWKKSALFVDDMYLADKENVLISHLFAKTEPELRRFTRAQLSKTFRFGQNLADILSSCVYNGIDLVSAECTEGLKITSLNAILKHAPQKKRQNQAEVAVIATYLGEHPELYSSDDEGAFAILTPYNNQVSLLNGILVQARQQERIMNIHKAQGREWDTVLLSVVDGPFNLNKPWFTDTTTPRSGGLYVMNTAVSRARKHLIIVCDKGYWTQPAKAQQLISRLLRACC